MSLKGIRTAIWSGLWVLLVTTTVAVGAQGTCTELVEDALDQFDRFCTSLDRNTACYGNDLVAADFVDDTLRAETPFDAPGDITPLDRLALIEAATLDEAAQQWGLAALKLQTALPGTLPGQGVVFVLTGAAEVEGETTENPMQTFYFTTGVGLSNCREAPDVLYVQGPQNTQVDIRANGVDIRIGSTIALEADIRGMRVTSLSGGATITCPGGDRTVNIPEGFTVFNPNVLLQNEGLVGDGDDLIVLDCNWQGPSRVPDAEWLRLAASLQDDKLSFLNYQLPPSLPLAVAQVTCTVDTSGQPYTVAVGDTLTSIAQAFNITTFEIAEANCLTNPDVILPGQVLYLPVPLLPTPTPTPLPGPSGGGGSDDDDDGGGSTPPLPPGAMNIVAGEPQLIDLDQQFGTLDVEVLDDTSAPITTDTVTYTITSGNGVFADTLTNQTTAATNAAGIAQSAQIIPQCPGGGPVASLPPVEVEVTSDTISDTQTFTTLVVQNRQTVTAAADFVPKLGDACPESPAELVFDPGSAPYVINGGGYNINSDITLTGTGTPGDVLFDGLFTTKIFEVGTGGALTINFAVLQHGSDGAGNGGAIYTDGNVALSNVDLLGNNAINGGAIYVDTNGTLTTNAGQIGDVGVGNSATTDGGAIYNAGGTVTIIGTAFEDNQAGRGGALFNDGGTMELQGAIVGRPGTLPGPDFGNGTVVGTAQGGGIFNTGTLILNAGTAVQNNRANAGGGIYSDGGTLSLDATTVSENQSVTGGAGISNAGAGSTLTVQNTSNFFSNVVTGAGDGGAIKHFSGALLSISNTDFTGNTATNGDGGAIWTNSPVTYTGGNLDGNEANSGGGVGVSFATGPVTLDGVNFVNNSLNAGTDGSIITQDSSAVTIQNSTFGAGNTTPNYCFPLDSFTDGGGNNADDGSCFP